MVTLLHYNAFKLQHMLNACLLCIIYLLNCKTNKRIITNRCGYIQVIEDKCGNLVFTNTDTDSVDATDGLYVSIRSIRNGSVNASAEPGTVRIVSERSRFGNVLNFRRR